MRTRRPNGWVVFAILMLAGVVGGRALLGRSEVPPGEIAVTLLQLHHRWATNGFRPPPENPVFANIRRAPLAAAAGPMNAYVQYLEEFFPLRRIRVYDLIRVRPGSSQWELYEIQTMERPPLPWLNSKRLLLTITNAPSP